ncbi:Alpha-endosulfine [Schistosoma japonicum]|uniref:Alpha-endosulfine n=1 Tax=Schistosoma japonicum TaxID=6182 RepID=Q5D9K4_SCHJA|nr:SJCHGC02194 protein [Schistosoma japonicum]TNN17950.1 Alpha-endosulfine [Schistosoma japonicum]TNN17951.1 Alpha-endosulfine [Schistosoma japonicum]
MGSLGSGDEEEFLKKESEKLRAKYPGLVNNASSLLHRRLSKNVKYFDSGDYNMAKSRPVEKDSLPSANLDSPTGDTIPTVDNISLLRNKSISLHNNNNASSQSSPTPGTTVNNPTTTSTTCRYVTIPARTQVIK